jgi:hypothetical protein
MEFMIFTFRCCILLRIYPTGSLWCRQSQQSFNTLTPFYFLCHSLHVSTPTGYLQVRYTIRYFNGLFLIQRIRCTYAIWCRDVICCTSVLWLVVLINVIKLNKNCKIIKILPKNFLTFYIWDLLLRRILMILQFLFNLITFIRTTSQSTDVQHITSLHQIAYVQLIPCIKNSP